MRCIKCGHQMEAEAERTLEAEVRGERFVVRVAAAQCSHCRRVLLSGKGRRAYHRASTDAYRSAHDLLTMKELDLFRRNLGMTWMQFASHVGVGIATMKRWMSGEIQSPSLDQLVRLKADHEYARRAANELLMLISQNASEQTIEMNYLAGTRRVRVQQGTSPTAERQKPENQLAESGYALCA